MRVLVVHNAYLYRGGEDVVVENEARLLRSRGHSVRVYRRSNEELSTMNGFAASGNALWSPRAARELTHEIEAFRPDIVHVHNTFPLLSPSVYWAAARARVGTVQTLHNYRLICLQAMLLRNSAICEDCVGRLPWRGVVRRCYRSSFSQSGVAAATLAFHRALGTYRNKVTRYIALNDFSRRKFIEGGLPAARISVKPNFVEASPPAAEVGRSGFLYVGRLFPEKGIRTLAEAAAFAPEAEVRVAGTGPEAACLDQLSNVHMLGQIAPADVRSQMARAICLVFPSVCNETFGLVVVEAFASGLPVIASRLGSAAELVAEGRTGLLFEPGNSRDLAERMRWALRHPVEMARMGAAARREYEAKYTPNTNYAQLLEIYELAKREAYPSAR